MTIFQCMFILVFLFFTYNIICEQLINISLFIFIFRFTNIEDARVITSAFKSSIEIPLFPWSQVSRHPDWRPIVSQLLGAPNQYRAPSLRSTWL